MQIGEILQSRRFLINLALILALSLVLLWLGFKLLNIYTRHGSNYVVPDFSGMTPEAIEENRDFNKFRVVVFDSIYDNSRPGGVVIDQDPAAGTEVKRNRTINITVVSKQQELVSMPDLGNTIRSARSQLEAYGLTVGKVIEVSGEYTGLLIGAYYLGKTMKEGDKVPKGGRIDLEVSTGRPGVDSLSESYEEEEPDLSF